VKKVWRQKGWLKTYFSQSLKGTIGPHTLDNLEPPIDFIISIANHFEPRVSTLGLAGAIEAIKEWCGGLEKIATRDFDGNPFKHTYYFPGENYNPGLLAPLEEHCKKGFGEVEVHLHHGLEKPDNADHLEKTLEEYIKNLRLHGFLSYDKTDNSMKPRYCFVHGNWTLANSGQGEFCGVDNEMEILAKTGCYMDCTLPSAPHFTQINKINSIYECGFPLSDAIPHRDGRDLAVGSGEPTFPFLLEGPLLINWKRKKKGIYVPGIENGAIHDLNPPTLDRFRLWVSANIHVKGHPNWIFIKLHTHSLRNNHINSTRGLVMTKYLNDIGRFYNDGTKYRLHFATSRESANIILAAIDGKTGNAGKYRNYRFILFES